MENFRIAQVMKEERHKIAEAALLLQLSKMPEMGKRYSPYQMGKATEDMKYHLQFLESALFGSSPPLFVNYLQWLKELLENLDVPLRDLRMSVVYLGETLKSRFPDEYEKGIGEIVAEGIAKLDADNAPSETFLIKGLTYSNVAEEYLELLLRGERFAASELIQNEVKNGAPIKEIYLQVFQNTQYEIGRLWQIGKISVAQEHYCTAASQFVMAQLYPYIFKVANKGETVVATCVGSELHEIGIRMVTDFLELSGFNTYYMGANTPTESIIKTLIDQKSNILAVSATMTFHIPEVAALIQKIRETEGCEQVKIMVGGYPFNMDHNLWRIVGADRFSKDSEAAVLAVMELIKEAKH